MRMKGWGFNLIMTAKKIPILNFACHKKWLLIFVDLEWFQNNFAQNNFIFMPSDGKLGETNYSNFPPLD